MTNLNIQTIDSSLVVDSRLVAAELGIEHRALKKTIQTYQSDFEEFGNLNTASVGVVGTSSYAEFYYLTEDQAYLSLTYSNNTQQVRQAKINLIKAFKQAREKAAQPQLPTDYLTALKALVAAEEEKSQLALKAAAAESKVIEMAPKVELYNVICEAGQNLKVGQLAKILCVKNMGPNQLFNFLRNHQVLMAGNLPYQRYVNDGYFTCIQKQYKDRVYMVTLVTPKGVEFVTKVLKQAGHIVPSKAA
jgi:anti-repressor protein